MIRTYCWTSFCFLTCKISKRLIWKCSQLFLGIFFSWNLSILMHKIWNFLHLCNVSYKKKQGINSIPSDTILKSAQESHISNENLRIIVIYLYIYIWGGGSIFPESYVFLINFCPGLLLEIDSLHKCFLINGVGFFPISKPNWENYAELQRNDVGPF